MGKRAEETSQAVPFRGNPRQLRIGMFSNRKPNTDAWQHFVADHLQQEIPGVTVSYFGKRSSSAPALEADLDLLSVECDLAVTGTGD